MQYFDIAPKSSSITYVGNLYRKFRNIFKDTLFSLWQETETKQKGCIFI
jgi:hypothetical protein